MHIKYVTKWKTPVWKDFILQLYDIVEKATYGDRKKINGFQGPLKSKEATLPQSIKD